VYEQYGLTKDEIQLVEGAALGSDFKIDILSSDYDKIALQRQIDATDRQIDQLVYELYGLTEDEIEIVEGQ